MLSSLALRSESRENAGVAKDNRQSSTLTHRHLPEPSGTQTDEPGHLTKQNRYANIDEMVTPAHEFASPGRIPVTPTVEVWRKMTAAEKLAFQLDAIDAMNAAVEVMGEGRPHKKAKSRTIDALSLHFKATGRTIYLAEELPVLYPGVEAFTPDILAVVDVAEPEDDERMAWVVADESRGLDLVIEVLYKGKRDKDLVDNVERYAQLGIPEYFVYDRWKHKLLGYRLPGPGAKRYEPLMPQFGRYHSRVLGLDMQVVGTELRFLSGEAELPGSAKLIDRLQDMVLSVTTKLEQAETRIGQAEAQVVTAITDAIDARARGVLAVLQVRGFEVSEAARARIVAERDAKRLDEWLEKAIVARTLADVLDDG